MASEWMLLLVSFTALTFVVFYLGRVLTFLLKVAIAVGIAFFIFTQVDFRKWEICRGARTNRAKANVATEFLCK